MKDIYKIEYPPMGKVHQNEKNPRLIKDVKRLKIETVFEYNEELFEELKRLFEIRNIEELKETWRRAH